MFPAASRKPPSTSMNSASHERAPMCVQGDSGLVLTTDPKPRLRWTAELHDRFLDAVNQLGGPDKATPKTIMRVMGVKGLTLYHLKSHLQKFRLGKQPHREFNDPSLKEAMDLQRNTASSSRIMGRSMNESLHGTEALRMQMEVHRRLHEQLEVQKHLQLRIEAQGKYMQSILEKAYQTLAADQGLGYNKEVGDQLGFVQDMAAASMGFHDLQLFGGGDLQLDNLHQVHLNQPLDHGLYLTPNDPSSSLIGKKIMATSHDPYITNPNEKSPFIWDDEVDDDNLHVGKQEEPSKIDQLHQNIGIAPGLIDAAAADGRRMVDVYEAKPMISNAGGSEGSTKMDRPSPLRDHPLSMEGINAMLIGGSFAQ
ncbi:myb family transcription factor IPN2-like [Curcuma longa]|uniref:myb family transcription factor IPN2-like n=1 Tax=Curcuma longa TaxID=136217 RepID=UPI003D9E22E2